MTVEEKEAIEILEGFEPDDLVECAIYRKAINTITNLIQKQKKIIDKMAKYIDEHTYRNVEECEFGETNNIICQKDCENCIKQYFERQVEENE